MILVVYRLLHLLSKDGWKMVCLQVLSCFDTHKKNGQKKGAPFSVDDADATSKACSCYSHFIVHG